METEVLESHNQEQGFWETTRLDYEEEETQKRRNLAFETLLLLSGKDAEEIREFLDSRIGRHIADEVDVLLYTFKNPNRIYQDYAMCSNRDKKIYYIGIQYIK